MDEYDKVMGYIINFQLRKSRKILDNTDAFFDKTVNNKGTESKNLLPNFKGKPSEPSILTRVNTIYERINYE